jgi:hypothetical protein
VTRQLDVLREQRETTRRDALVRALEFGLVGALANQGWTVRGFGIKISDLDCLMTIRVERDGKWFRSFVATDSMITCFLKAERQALGNTLVWGRDKYQKGQT